MVDLEELFTILRDKGYFYCEGVTNMEGGLRLDFSTARSGRGDSIVIHIKPNSCDIEVQPHHSTGKEGRDIVNVHKESLTYVIQGIHA